MIHDPQHTLTALAVEPPSGLLLTFADGAVLPVDLAALIAQRPALAALGDPALFRAARVDALGGYVVWVENEIEMAADNLRDMAIEQSGGISRARLHDWIYRHALTQEQAAQAIGISRRMLNYYLSGAKPVPKNIWLACIGWETLQAQVAA